MGNSIIDKRIKGITMYYAKDHIFEFKKGDFLRIVPEFNNAYDHNALAIYDDYNHKLGHIDKESNVEIYRTIKDVDYVCVITSVNYDYSFPSIQFQIIYRTSYPSEAIRDSLFNEYLLKYRRDSVSKTVSQDCSNDKSIASLSLDDLFSAIEENKDSIKYYDSHKIKM